MKRYDIAILGGGAAGLSLALHLASSPLRDLSVVIVDKEVSSGDDRTWCFWSRHPGTLAPAIHRSWGHLRFVSDRVDRRFSIEPYRYNMLRGVDFYRFARSHLAQRPGFEMKVRQVEGVEEGENEAQVKLAGETLRARWVFDSRFPTQGYEPDPKRHTYLLQHFLGWEVEADGEVFDPEAATLFDLRTEQRGGLCFFYVLPLGRRRALVEYTVFSTERFAQSEYERSLCSYLEGTLGVQSYRVVGVERGAIPMTDHPLARRLGERTTAIGTAGGMVKPSTGYAFARIQRDSREIVNSLVRHGHPFAVHRTPLRYRLYDSLILDVMEREPHMVKPAFEAMFTRNDPARILRFLDESSSPLEEAALIASLPSAPFLRAVGHRLTARTFPWGRPRH